MHKAGRGSERGLGTSMDNTLPDYCPWYRVTKYLESLRVVRWHDTATMYGAKNKLCINGERSNCLPRHVLIDVIPSCTLFQRAWALLLATHRGNCDYSIIACLITVILFYSIPFHSISRSIDSGMPC